MKKIAMFSCLLCFLLITACSPQAMSDQLRFKIEYEALNGKTNAEGIPYRCVSIEEVNPIRFSDYEEILSLMDGEESFAVLFAFSRCPWCRGCIETLLSEAESNEIDTIYYVDVYTSRDKFEYKDGIAQKTEEGAAGYSELIKELDSVLSDYTIKGNAEEEIDTGEKRIYAPNLVIIKDGIPVYLAGDCQGFKDPYDELSNETLEEMHRLYNGAFQKLN